MDGNGHVYVADTYNNRIQKFDSDSTFVLAWGVLGSDTAQFEYPSGVASNSAGTRVYVADTQNQRIQYFDGSGHYLGKWGNATAVDDTALGKFSYPTGVAVDSAGNLYVADSNNNRIQKFTAAGAFLAAWGTYGSGHGEFNLPEGVAVDASGNIFVTDNLNNRIEKLSGSGSFLSEWGTAGSAGGQFNSPYGVAVDGAGRVYVVDQSNARVEKFAGTDTTLLAAWGSLGGGPGQFDTPFAVAVDGSGMVYVADTNNHRIERFKPPASGVPAGGGAHVAFALSGAPNPARSAHVLRFVLPAATPVHVGIYDLAGRSVRQVDLGELSAGAHGWTWDIRDAEGRDVASGVYMARVECRLGVRTSRIAVLK